MLHYFLRRALQLAQIHRGFCAPNPAVGAIVVDNQQIVGMGAHRGSGTQHAEIIALSQAGSSATHATLYSTLEPCCHLNKKTPPCIEAIVHAKIKKVIYAYRDPNPAVSGRGEAALQAAGIDCVQISLPQIDLFYRSYQHWWQHQKPFVTAKLATSLDGQVCGVHNERIYLTGQQAFYFTHQQRRSSDALLTTVNTINQDNPSFNVRLDKQLKKPLFILDRQLHIKTTARIFETTGPIFILHHAQDEKKQAQLTKLGARCIEIAETNQGLDLNEVMHQIGQLGYHDVWVECGQRCLHALIQQQLIQRAFIYIAPTFIDQNQFAIGFNNFLAFTPNRSWVPCGSDLICELNWSP
jgi:diaminohydroxyphosphoribosylaminopyrimidine deaminase / 5-amino-6-(5-phosphoribosylamino)uracil reductase